MTQGSWKKLSIMVTVLLLISLTFSISLWYQLNNAEIQTNNSSAQMNAISLEIESLKAKENQILSNYAGMRSQINTRLGIGPDSQRYITPDDPKISAIVQGVTGGYSEEEFWKDYTRLFQWVMANIKYSLDSPFPLLPESIDETFDWGEDFWRMPAETIRDKTGDCEDMATLLASMLLNYNQRRFPIWVVGVRDFNANPQAHIAVAIPLQNNQLAIFDTAGRYFTSFSNLGGFGSQDFPLALQHWINHLEAVTPDAQVYVAFSEDFYQEFSSNEEFTDWAGKLFLKDVTLPQKAVILD